MISKRMGEASVVVQRSASTALFVGLLAAACSALPASRPTFLATPGATELVTESPAETAEASQAPSPTSSQTPGPTFTPSPIPTPASTPPADLGTEIVAERDDLGLRMTVRFQRNPMPAGEVSEVDTEMLNIGKHDVLWTHDGCAKTIGVNGTMSDVKWPLGTGQAGVAAEYKRMALYQWDGSIYLSFVFQSLLGKGSYGCADSAVGERIAPGDSIKQRLYWDGLGRLNGVPPPRGAVDIRLYAGYYSRPGQSDEGPWIVEQKAFAWVSADPQPALLSPAEAIDKALAVPEFIAWLGNLHLGNGNEPYVVFNRTERRWEVGTVIWNPTAQLHLILIEGVTGEFLGVVDRPFDYGSDPAP